MEQALEGEVRKYLTHHLNYGKAAKRMYNVFRLSGRHLDAAFVHLNLGDETGNAAYTGIDPYFDDLFLMAARRRFLSVERIVPTAELVESTVPQQLLVNRMMVDAVVEAPNGAHFTTNEPDYRRDEKFQRHYAEAAGSPETWTEFVKTYLSGSEDDYQAAVRKFKEAQA